MAQDPQPGRPQGGDVDAKTTQHVRGAVRGDAEDITWVIRRFTPVLLVQARYRLGSLAGTHVSPEDVVQEAWLRSLDKLPAIRPREGRYTPVLLSLLSQKTCGLATNYLKQFLVRRKREGAPLAPASSEDSAAESPYADSVQNVFRDVASRDDARRVMAALKELDPQDVEVIVMRGVEGLSNQEIAAQLGDKPNTIAQRYKRALARLRERVPRAIFDEFEEE